MKPTEKDLAAAKLLQEKGPFKYPSQFGMLLLETGVYIKNPRKRYSQQGLAFMAARALHRLEKAELAEWSGSDGWRAVR